MEAWERIQIIMEKEGLNKNSFSKAIGMTNNVTITRIVNEQRTPSYATCQKIVNAFPQYNLDWIISGKGEMTKPSDTSDKPVGQKAAYPSDASDLSDIDFRLVPILHIDSVGGMHSDNAIVAEPQYVEGYAPFTDAKDGDICIIQSGDSMVPTCPSGSLLLLRQVTNWQDYFGYGNIFVLELTDGRRITKEITRYDANPQEYVWCVSHNPNVPDEELPKKMIASVWKVIKIQIDKGW